MSDDDRIIMPWGKHKGEYIDSLPSSYLYWLSLECDFDTKIQEAADEEWWWREAYDEHSE